MEAVNRKERLTVFLFISAWDTTLGGYSTKGTYCQYAPYVLQVR